MKIQPTTKALIWDLSGVILRSEDFTRQTPPPSIRLSSAMETEPAWDITGHPVIDPVEHDLVDFIRAVRSSYRTALLVYPWEDLSKAFENLWQFEDAFDEIFVPAEPSRSTITPLVFRQVVEQLDVAENQAVLIDDDPENLRTAQMTGLRSIWYKTPAQVGSELFEILAEHV